MKTTLHFVVFSFWQKQSSLRHLEERGGSNGEIGDLELSRAFATMDGHAAEEEEGVEQDLGAHVAAEAEAVEGWPPQLRDGGAAAPD